MLYQLGDPIIVNSEAWRVSTKQRLPK